MIEVQTFNAGGDVVASDVFMRNDSVLRMARKTFDAGNGMAINGRDCFTFAEVERALRVVGAEVVA